MFNGYLILDDTQNIKRTKMIQTAGNAEYRAVLNVQDDCVTAIGLGVLVAAKRHPNLNERTYLGKDLHHQLSGKRRMQKRVNEVERLGRWARVAPAFPAGQGCYLAAALLEQIMAGHLLVPQTIRVCSGPVVVRQSTDIMAIEDQLVAHAARYIRVNACQITSVQQVARAMCLSLRQLQKRFHKALAVTLRQEIRRHRIRAAARMLLESDLSIAYITRRIGYDNPANVARAFRNEMGITPRDYRQRYSLQNDLSFTNHGEDTTNGSCGTQTVVEQDRTN